jgi:hypothetical protein
MHTLDTYTAGERRDHSAKKKNEEWSSELRAGGKKEERRKRAQMSYIQGREMKRENAEHRQKGESCLYVNTVLE